MGGVETGGRTLMQPDRGNFKELSGMAREVEPRHTWRDLILAPDQHAQLRETCNHARRSPGRRLHVLFRGPPESQKIIAAEVIARELRLGLYRIDLSQVVSKYVGETEQNLDRIFRAAHDANAILFFDEADALFGKRSDMADGHDRYANIEVGCLLRKMEEHEGMVIVATNLRQMLDDAFLLRMHVIVEFFVSAE